MMIPFMKKNLFLTFTATTIFGLLSSFPEGVVGDGCCALTKPPGSKEEDYYCINPSNMKTQRCITAKVATARWMAQNLEWGTLSTLRTDANGNGINGDITPFGNTYSFSDGPCGGGTGTPYFYGTDLDVSWNEAAENPMVSFALSEASLTSDCVNRTDDGLSACVISASGGDPEAPVSNNSYFLQFVKSLCVSSGSIDCTNNNPVDSFVYFPSSTLHHHHYRRCCCCC